MGHKAVAVAICFVVVAAGAEDVGQGSRDDARLAVTVANNAFAFDLYEVLRKQEGNLVVSPLSAAAVLSLAYLGAAGNTAAEMRTALHLPEGEERIAGGYRALLDSFKSSDELTLVMANKVFTDKAFRVKERFQKIAVENFRAAAEEVDFQRAAEEARLSINDWVEGTTEGKIKDLIPEGALDPKTVMVLVNAIYFHGQWEQSLDEGQTRSEPFHVSATEEKNVDMMRNVGTFMYVDAVPGMNARALELPYVGEQAVRMMIILPNEIDGLSEVESKFRELNLMRLEEYMTREEVVLSMPKFTVESSLPLHKTLPELGMRDIFKPAGANFSGITDRDVFVSQVLQKAFVEVNEKGTTAAAATAVIMKEKLGSVIRPEPIIFTVDRPFAFMLISGDNTLMFIGRIRDP